MTPTATNAIPQHANPTLSPTDIVIAVMGITGVGKSTFISYFSDEEVVIGHDLEACTAKVAIVPATLPNGTKLYLVDTPGFDDTYKSDTDILREVAAWLAEAYKKKVKLSGIVYLHRIMDVRLGGAAMKNLRMFKALCGEEGLKSVVLATTHWSKVSPEEGAKREHQLCTSPKMWKPMLDEGSKLYRHDRDATSALDIIQYLVKLRRPVTLDIQRDLVDAGKTLDATAAGKEVAAEMERQRIEFEKRYSQLRAEMAEALVEKDRQRQADLREWKVELDTKMQEARRNEEKLRADQEALRRQLHEENMAEKARLLEQVRERERAAAREEARLEAMEAQHYKDLEIMRHKYELEKIQEERDRLKSQLSSNDNDYDSDCIIL